MLRIKKLFISVFVIISIFSLSFGEGLKSGPVKENFKPGDSGSPQIEGEEIEDIDEGHVSFSEKLQGILHLRETKDGYTTSLGHVIALIQIIINWTLAMLSVVALVYMLYCGFLVFTSGSDDKNASKGKKGLTTGAIAIAGIAISWLIISAMIRLIGHVSVSVG